MAIDYDKLNMPTKDTPIFSQRPATPSLNIDQATREAATQRMRSSLAGVTPTQAKQPGVAESAIQQVVPQATAQVSQGRMEQRKVDFTQAQAQQSLAEQQRQGEAREELFRRAVQIEDENEQNIKALSSMDSGIAATLFYDNLKFREDELGRTTFNERQLADWAALKSKNQEEFASYEQTMYQALERRQQTLRVAYSRVKTALEQEYLKDEAVRDQELIRTLTIAKANLEKKQREAEARAANTVSLFSTIGNVVGTIVGGIIGGVAGAAAGAVGGAGIGAAPGAAMGAAGGAAAGGALGKGLGTMAGSAVAGSPGVSDASRDDTLRELRTKYGLE